MSAKHPVKPSKQRPNRSFVSVVTTLRDIDPDRRMCSKRRVAHDFSHAPSRTEQSHADSCSIKLIVSKHLGKDASPLNFSVPAATWQTGNGQLPDFHEAQNYIAEMNSQFHALPARSRAFFENDPALYFEFCSDPSNRDHMLKMGINTDHLPPVKPAATVSTGAKAPTEPAPAGQNAQ